MDSCHGRRRSARAGHGAIPIAVFLLASLVPSTLPAQSSHTGVSTVVTTTAEGTLLATTTVHDAASIHPSRLFVRFKPGRRALLPGSGLPRGFRHDSNLVLIDTPYGMSVLEALRHYRASPTVDYAEPDFEVHVTDTIPTDPLWLQQWDMAKIAAPAAWDTHTSAGGIVVAIIDTGIAFGHPDLAGNVSPANSFTCIGSCIPGGDDDFGHGTHVAGTIGAAANNGSGIAGINWSVEMISLKFLNASGSGYISDAVLAFQKILELKAAGVNIRVTNNSWGGGGFSQALKDAMAAVEASGVVNVCAAGNSASNADVLPMYPGAYDNRGIISVAATDSNDVGAYFTNYGLASVDIAAPGVSTLSTVPTGSCSLCDPTGYKLLSGTSMATPHAAGVVAAMLHINPALTAAQARDVLLDPGSYDPIADALGSRTSTGGRLNFYKAISNPKLLNPGPLNTFPTLTLGPDVYASSGGNVTVTASASDADGDPLRFAWGTGFNVGQSWMLGWMANQIFPVASGNGASFTAPIVGRPALAPYQVSVSDSRGGGATDTLYVVVNPASLLIGPPTGSFSAPVVSAPAGSTLTFNFSPVDPDGMGPAMFDIFASHKDGLSGWCCFGGPSVGLNFPTAGVYRVGVQAMDRSLQSSDKQSVVVAIGGATGMPPIARATLDRTSDAVPFTVNIDMSASSDLDGAIESYFFNCGLTSNPSSTTPYGQCTFTEPGNYWLELMIRDNDGLMDVVNMYVVAVPSTDDVAPPTGLTATAGTGAVTLTWNATAGAASYGVKRGTSPGGPYGTTVATVLTNTSFVDTTVTNGVAYSYVVYAIGGGAPSSDSVPASATPIAVPTVSASAASGQVVLLWSTAAGATSYRVKRSLTSAGGYVTIASSVTGTTYTDTGRTNGATYYYTVAGANPSGQGTESTPASATPLGAPTGLSAVAGDASVSLAWGTVVGATTYTVKRSTSSSGPFVPIAPATGIAATSFFDTGLVNGTTYYYVILARNASGTGPDSTKVSAKPVLATLKALTIPMASAKGGALPYPTGTVTLTVAAPAGGKSVVLSSSLPTAASVPASVTVPAGATSVSFTVTTYAVTKKVNATIKCTLAGSNKQDTISITP